MAGGEGSRLRPLTSLMPKPMVPIVNQPVMEHILGLVKHHGIDEVVATLAFMPQAIEDYFGDGEEWGMGIEYAVEEVPLGTAGSVKNAQSLLPKDEPFIVISGDALTDINLREVIDFHKSKGAAVTITLKRVDDPLEYGVVITAEDGRIERFLEKPTWGQVFSDTINTGIYVMEPWVLDYIPDDGPFDFSSELFPNLMADGHALYGMISDGYWCDVGSIETYMQAHKDVLDGKACIYVPGVHAREGVWVDETASVDPEAQLGRYVVLGANSQIRAGAVVGDYVVIGDNCVVGNDARVSHTVVWNDTFIGKQSVVSGTILCRSVDVRARAVIDVGAVIGDESSIGPGAHVGSGVQVYPYKRVEPAATVNSSLIWESTAIRSLFVDSGICGLVGIDITPELALRVAEAFGTILPKGGHVVVTRDTSRQARMVKRAMVAGLNAAGINVRDLRVASPAVSRFTTHKTRCVGGIHVALVEDDRQSLEIRFFDKNGLDIAPWEQKKIERLYFRGEFRRAFFEDVGEIMYPPRPIEYYTAALQDALHQTADTERWTKVIADMACGTASLILPQVAQDWKVNLISLNSVVDSESSQQCGDDASASLEEMARGIELFGGDFGIAFDRGAERIRLVTGSGRMLDGDTALHAIVDLWCRTRHEAGVIAVPLTASTAVDRIAEKHGRTVIRPGRSRRALAQSVLDGRAAFAGSPKGGFIFGEFFPAFDGVMTMGMLSRMLVALDTDLDTVVLDLPEFHKTSLGIFSPNDRKGAVMRAITERSGDTADLTEGVRVADDTGWVLVLPDPNEPVVGIWAEGATQADAEARAREWRLVVEAAVEGRAGD